MRFLFFELLGVFDVFVTDNDDAAGTIVEFGEAPIPSRPGIR